MPILAILPYINSPAAPNPKVNRSIIQGIKTPGYRDPKPSAWELDCMEIGLHGHLIECVLGLEPLHGRPQTACWSRGLHAGAEDCDPLGLMHVLHSLLQALNRHVEREFIRPVTATTA